MIKWILTGVISLVTILSFAQTFTLKSNELGGQSTIKQMFNGLGVGGENISPELFWENAPQETRSFAVTIYDPTAPTGSGWWHWVIFDIPDSITELKSGTGTVSKNLTPMGAIQSVNDLGQLGYMGPAPPPGSGFHQYVITVYALKVAKLQLTKETGPALVGFYLNNSAIGKASIVMYCNQLTK